MSKRRTFIKEVSTLGALYPLIKARRSHKSIHLDEKRSIVCVGGHPDDPESGCGGTLSLYAKAGNKVSIVYLTRGESGISGKSPDETALIRSHEAEEACAILGAQPHFFGQVNGDAFFNKTAITRMHELLMELKPDILFTHWPVDSHPDHQIASLLSYQSWLKMEKSFQIYYFEVNSGSQTMQFAPTDYIDITDVATQKKNALYQHKSQHPDDIYFKHHFVMQQFRGREIGVKEAEAFVRLDGAKHVGLI
jgi:LmbE family N-acetylglucosaminyl deacetylase